MYLILHSYLFFKPCLVAFHCKKISGHEWDFQRIDISETLQMKRILLAYSMWNCFRIIYLGFFLWMEDELRSLIILVNYYPCLFIRLICRVSTILCPWKGQETAPNQLYWLSVLQKEQWAFLDHVLEYIFWEWALNQVQAIVSNDKTPSGDPPSLSLHCLRKHSAAFVELMFWDPL